MRALMFRRWSLSPWRRRTLMKGYQTRAFHDYFVTHIPSSSAHTDSRRGQGHGLPRGDSVPHDSNTPTRPVATPSAFGCTRELTVVRIPLLKARHHYGSTTHRVNRPDNEDRSIAGTLNVPGFAKERPQSFRFSNKSSNNDVSNTASDNGDPQVFYFGVFDGHGGSECSEYLKQNLHLHIEEAAHLFDLQSTLRSPRKATESATRADDEAIPPEYNIVHAQPESSAVQLQRRMIKNWKDMIGGYYRRFKPEYFRVGAGGQGKLLAGRRLQDSNLVEIPTSSERMDVVGEENRAKLAEVLSYAFLDCDAKFCKEQLSKEEDRGSQALLIEETAVGEAKPAAESKPFLGGSTCSIALLSTPTSMAFWAPEATSTLVTAHCGDTRILLCDTKYGNANPLTSNHHPDAREEADRIRRYAPAVAADAFGEVRVAGLANSRAFGDIGSKRLGVSAEPEILRVELEAGQYSFMVLMSDGASGHLSDQEVCDIVKEAKTPEDGAQAVAGFAAETSLTGDNVTVLVVRLGGWSRRTEGGRGSLRTKEERDFKKQEALDPRSRRR